MAGFKDYRLSYNRSKSLKLWRSDCSNYSYFEVIYICKAKDLFTLLIYELWHFLVLLLKNVSEKETCHYTADILSNERHINLPFNLF